MNNSLFKFLFVLAFSLLLCVNSAFSQQARVNALSIKQSNVIEDLKAYKAAHPEASVETLVETANAMLDKQGFNYGFVFDENTCQRLQQSRKAQKDPKTPLNLQAKLSSVAGDTVSIILPNEQYEKSECGRCFVSLPVWEANEKEFVTYVQAVNVKFYLPPGFWINEVALVDNSNLSNIVRRWKVPFRAEPISISNEGKIIFLPLPDNDLNDLALAIFDEGVIQFYARKNIDQNIKGSLMKDSPKDPGNPNLTFITFENGNLKQMLRYTSACTN